MTFATTRDFQAALLPVIRHASRANPSRHEIADQLESLAQRLGATRKKSPSTRKRGPSKKDPAPVPQRVLVNIGKEEHSALQYVQNNLTDALDVVEREVRMIHDAIERIEDDAKDSETEVDKDMLESAWWENSRSVAGDIIDHFKRGLEYLADKLADHAPVTQEQDLSDAVLEFAAHVPKDYGGDWPEGKGEKLFKDVAKAIQKGIDKVPNALGKPSELGRLREVFEAIAEAIKLMTGKSIAVPRIPNALDPEDPRQLGFAFSASRRIATTLELKARLDAIWRAASTKHPSRQQLSAALFDVASSLR